MLTKEQIDALSACLDWAEGDSWTDSAAHATAREAIEQLKREQLQPEAQEYENSIHAAAIAVLNARHQSEHWKIQKQHRASACTRERSYYERLFLRAMLSIPPY